MAESRKILYWHGVVGDVLLRAQYSKVLEKLMNGEYAAAKYHKLTDYDVYSVYEDGKDRLIVTTEEIDGKLYLLVLKALPDHDYHNLDKRVLERYIERNREQIIAQARAEAKEAKEVKEEKEEKKVEWEEVDEKAIAERFGKIKSAKDLQINFSPADYQQDKCIEYNEKQKDIICTKIWGTKGFQKLIDLQGPAGSGKSLVALVMAENYEEGDVIYLAPTEILARDSEAKFKQMCAGKPRLSHAVEFFSRKEYFMQNSNLEFADSESDKEQNKKWQFVDEEEFIAWLPDYCNSINSWAKQQKIDGVLKTLKKHGDLIHQEFFSLGIHKNESSYQKHPDERAIFAKSTWRQLVWKMYNAYKLYLPTKKFIDINLASIELKKQEKLIIIDEAHDFSLHDLCYLPTIFKDCVLISDPHQRTVSCLSMVPDLKEFLGRQDLVPFTLTDPMRYPAPTARVANATIKFKCKVSGGTPYKGAYIEIPITAEHEKKPGEGIFLTTTEVAELKKMVAELKKKFSIVDEIALAIPLKNNMENKEKNKKILEGVREWFDGDLIFTNAKQIKGLGYKAVIMFEPFKEGIYQANRKYRALTQSDKPVVDQVQGINGDIIFNKDINEFFTFLTRNSHTFVICQKVDRNIDELAKLIRAEISPGVTVVAATLPEEKDKREDKQEDKRDEARSLAEAQKQVQHGNYEIAKNIFKRLGKSDSEYAEFEKQHKVQLRQQKKPAPDIAPASSRSPDALFASGSARPGHKEHVQATPASTAKVIKKTTTPGNGSEKSASAAAFTKLLPIPDTANILFKREKNHCIFLRMIRNEDNRKQLLGLVQSNPDYFSNIPLLDLFETYQLQSINNISIILMMLMFHEFRILLKVLMAKLSDDDLIILIKKIQEEIRFKINGKEHRTSIFCYAIVQYPEFLLFLINAYPKIASMFSASELSRLREETGDSVKIICSPVELISESEIACEFFDKCRQQNPRLLTELDPETMFRIYDNGNKVKTTVFNNILLSFGDEGLQLLTDWLANTTWMEFVYNAYKTKTHKDLILFTELIINSLIHYWKNVVDSPMQRLLNRYPDFLFMLVKRGFFAAAERSLSTFGLLSGNSANHSALKTLFDSDAQYYSEIDFKEFFDTKTNKHGLVEEDVPLRLAQSEAGAELLKNIIKARKAIRENLASAVVLCSPRLLAGSPLLTCLYLTLKTTSAGRVIIEQFQQHNPSLNSETINRLLIENNLDYLNDEELASIESVKRELTFDNLLALLVKPNAARLLFIFDGQIGFVLSKYLFENNDRLALFYNVIRTNPTLVQAVLPPDFLGLGISFGTTGIISNLKSLLSQPAGGDVVKLLCKHPEYREQIRTEHIFSEPGFDPAHKLFDDIIRDKKLHWLLDELIENKKFVLAITNRFFAHKIADGVAFSVICRYHPELIIKLAQKVQQDSSMGLSPGKMIFGNPGMIVQNFYWLSKHPPAHKLLLSIFESEPTLLDRIPASALGLTLKAWPDSEEVSSLFSLTQSEAGRKIIGLYIADPKRLKLMATPALCCKAFNLRSVISELSHLSPALVEQFDPRLIAQGLAVTLSPEEVFMIDKFKLENGDYVTTSAFCNVPFHEKDRFAHLTFWLENDAYIDYIINLYKTKPHDDLLLATELIICPLLYHWRTAEKPPMLKLLQKHPDFISHLVSNGIFNKVMSSGAIEKIAIELSVFDLLCSHPAYHTYLHNSVSWGRFQQLTLEEFFENSQPNVPFNLSTTTDGLKFLYSILMLRPDICKRLATFDELFARLRFQAVDGVRTICLFDRLKQSEEGNGILKLLQQTNKMLVLPTDQTLHELGFALGREMGASLLSSMRPGK